MMNGCVASPLSADRLRELVQLSKDYLLSHGILLRTAEDPSCAEKVIHAPCVLLPSPVPRHCYTKAKAIQKDLNILMHKVAHDYAFLKNCLKSAIKNDDFTARLWDIYEKVRTDGVKQPYDLAIIRSDYMMDSGIPTADLLTSDTKVTTSKVNIKQIEINTIAASFGGLTSELWHFHRYMLNKMGLYDQSQQVPENKASEGIAEAFVAAWSKYGKPEAVILFVVQDAERNIYDQRQLEYAVNKINPRVTIVRRTITDLVRSTSLGKDSQLMIDGQEVAVVYLRALYTPDDLKSENDWAVRLLIERSAAIKCPSVHYQLAGTKKVQQELARPGVLETYLSDPDAISRIRDCFAGQYSLDMGAEGDETVAMAMKSPEKFVLKPQREGGGNNTFGEDIRTVLDKIGQSEERTAYILMERIHPVPMQNYPIMSGKPVETEPINMVSEMGVFGMLLGSAKDVELNVQKGHILRTKQVGVDEGGVSAGYSGVDSPYLIE